MRPLAKQDELFHDQRNAHNALLNSESASGWAAARRARRRALQVEARRPCGLHSSQSPASCWAPSLVRSRCAVCSTGRAFGRGTVRAKDIRASSTRCLGAGAAILTTNTDNSRATHTWQPGQLGGAQAAGAGRDIAFASPQQSDGSSSSSKTTATILMPSHMAHLGVNRPLAKEVAPTTWPAPPGAFVGVGLRRPAELLPAQVRRHTVGPSGGTQPWPVPLAGRRSALDRDVLALHWVITSCDR